MIIKAEFEIDYIREDETIDGHILRKAIEKVMDGFGDKMKERIQNEVDNAFAQRINAFIEDILSGFLDRNIVITDRYGDEVARYESAREMLKEKFDNFLSERVTDNGEVAKERNGCHSSSKPRIEYLVKKIVPSTATLQTEITKAASKEIDARLVSATKSAAEAVVSSLMSKIDLEAAIKSKQGV